jgi:3-deoxy-D-manno-octulosonate 8-phosphate phosphatase KdsC-like HAD superfamily phosphatase
VSDETLNAFFGKAKNVKLIAIGVDGVLTDAGMYFSSSGDMLRKFNRRDGMGIQLLKKAGIKSAVIEKGRRGRRSGIDRNHPRKQ